MPSGFLPTVPAEMSFADSIEALTELSEYSSAAEGVARWKTTLVFEGVSTVWMASRFERATAPVFSSRMRSIDALTSAEVKAEPSCHLTPARSVNVTVLPAAVQVVARPGARFPPSSLVSSVSYISARVCVVWNAVARAGSSRSMSPVRAMSQEGLLLLQAGFGLHAASPVTTTSDAVTAASHGRKTRTCRLLKRLLCKTVILVSARTNLETFYRDRSDPRTAVRRSAADRHPYERSDCRAVGVRQSHDLRDGRLWPLPDPAAVTGEEAFDLASVTKVAATTAVLMCLVDDGLIALDAPARDWLPAFDSAATVRDLLEHQAGLAEWVPTYVDGRTPPPRYPIGGGRHYSDLGFMLLGELAGAATGTPFARLADERVFAPLGMTDAHFRPAGKGLDRPLVATTHGDWIERDMVATGVPYPVDVSPDDFAGWRPYTVIGEVSDGNAWHARGGIAGHAGLFASADDLVALCRGLLASLAGNGLWSPSTVDDFLRPARDPEQAAGFRRWSAYGAIGHTGFTGCGFAIFPAAGRIAVLLTNRTHTPIGSQATVAAAWTDILAEVGAGGSATELPLWDSGCAK